MLRAGFRVLVAPGSLLLRGPYFRVMEYPHGKGGFIGPPPKFCCNLKVKSMVFIPLTILMFIYLFWRSGVKNETPTFKNSVFITKVFCYKFIYYKKFLFSEIQTKQNTLDEAPLRPRLPVTAVREILHCGYAQPHHFAKGRWIGGLQMSHLCLTTGI